MTNSPPIRLSELADAVRRTIDHAFADRTYWVIGDVTSHTFKADRNHHYFDLVEKGTDAGALLARLQARAWGKGALSIARFESLTGQRFTNNIRILAGVTVTYSPLYGLSLQLNEVDVNYTLGVLEQQRLATLERLVAENPEFIRKVGERYQTRNQELTMSRVIQKIAVVSSQTSAGREDFHHTLDSNPFGYRFVVDDYFTTVQGENNAEQLVLRLVDVFKSGKAYDAVVIIRGGGAQTDFLIFDQYRVGLAVAKFPIPVITGIGHQKNETIADLMAHTQTKTPTKAAEYVIERNRVFEETMVSLRQAVLIRAQQRFARHAQALARLDVSIVSQARATLQNRRRDVDHLGAMIRIASPASTLRRGFAIVKVGGRIVTDGERVSEGGDISVIFSGKEIDARVLTKKDYHGSEFDL